MACRSTCSGKTFPGRRTVAPFRNITCHWTGSRFPSPWLMQIFNMTYIHLAGSRHRRFAVAMQGGGLVLCFRACELCCTEVSCRRSGFVSTRAQVNTETSHVRVAVSNCGKRRCRCRLRMDGEAHVSTGQARMRHEWLSDMSRIVDTMRHSQTC
jgi:hypothetical protein